MASAPAEQIYFRLRKSHLTEGLFYFIFSLYNPSASFLGTSPYTGEAIFSARSPEKIIVCVWCSPRDVGTKFQAKSHLISRADDLTKPSPAGEGGIRAKLDEYYFLCKLADDG